LAIQKKIHKQKESKMKRLFNTIISIENRAAQIIQASHPFKLNTRSLTCLIWLSVTFLFTACGKQDAFNPGSSTQYVKPGEASVDMESAIRNETLKELQQARDATAKYRDINNAIADGYADINVVMPNMGYHFQKVRFVDSVFNVRRPELLVYDKKKDGSFELVAVEYAVPLDQSVNAPKGFTGKQDVWDHNTEFGLWTLHAWVWKDNPDGVFNPTNPDVHVRGM
jgi:hypothetical protein